ncbi:MAG TPA: translational GTPase TypA, partial [Candidatus Binatia bacterium]|nr:translational GTPase TypA [Candidatus Binatia bacterium]
VRGYEPLAGDLPRRGLGAVVVTEAGKTTAYSLFKIQERSTLFVGAGVPVYEGQVIGENRRDNDMNVNAVRAKKLTNIRAAGTDEALRLVPHRILSLEAALEFINEDELVEITPASIRMRKKILDAGKRPRRKE